MTLSTSIEMVKGVGPRTAEQLQLAGIETIRDLIYFFPRTYDDFSNATAVKDIQPGNVTLKARVEHVSTRRVRRGIHITEAVLADDSDKVVAVWFNQPYRVEQLKGGGEFVFSGEYSLQRQKYQLMNPSAEKTAEIGAAGAALVPVYRQVRGLKSQLLRKLLNELRPLMTMLPETLPEDVIRREKLMSHADAVLAMHFPEHRQELDAARERLGFEEVLSLMIASEQVKRDNAQLESWSIPFKQSEAKDFVVRLPFQLTGAQKVAAWEIIQNMESGEPMNRLLQGDVGSGKTVVAGMAAYLASLSGFQTAVMAPTELLARQHADTLQSLLSPLGVEVVLLVGSLKPRMKKQVQEHIANGAAAIVVGTHALIQEAVSFHKLGLVVIDEQHRFGVEQRRKLLQKSSKMPHLLTMTATPIPRSLQLTVYGDLNISLLLELPKGRKKIITEIISPNSRTQMYASIDDEITAGRQVYVVCPLIAEGENAELKSVEAEVKRLKSSVFKHRRIGLLHGKLTADDKQAVMSAFMASELDILVSTTVVEVGVDVPNATVMIIEGADRFGLAQLHQLRGRVGRSVHQSYCYIVPSTSQRPTRRLQEIAKSNDGFALAEIDLELRGPGEIYGRAQHGSLDLSVANIADTKLLRRVKLAAKWVLDSDIDLVQYKQLWSEVERYKRMTTLN